MLFTREPWTQCAACIDKNIPCFETELVELIEHKEFQNEGYGTASLKCGWERDPGPDPFLHLNAISDPNFYFHADPDDSASIHSDANVGLLINRIQIFTLGSRSSFTKYCLSMRIRIRNHAPKKVNFSPIWYRYRILQSHIANVGYGGLTLVAYCTLFKVVGLTFPFPTTYLTSNVNNVLFYFKGNVGQDAGADQTAELHQPPEPQLVAKPSPKKPSHKTRSNSLVGLVLFK